MSIASKKRRKLRRSIERAADRARSREQPKAWPERLPAKPNHVNVYVCEVCGAQTVTVDVHRGVTPFLFPRGMAEHRDGCAKDGMVRSCFYQPPPGHGPPVFEWYAPTRAEAERESRGMFEHAQRGGLFLRRIERAPASPSGGGGEADDAS